MSQVLAQIDISEIIEILEKSKDLDEARRRFADLYFKKAGDSSPLLKLISWSKTGKVERKR
jgi:hypothetical protein